MENGATGLTLAIVLKLVEKEVKNAQERVQSHNLVARNARERLKMFSRVELLNAQVRFMLFFGMF